MGAPIRTESVVPGLAEGDIGGDTRGGGGTREVIPGTCVRHLGTYVRHPRPRVPASAPCDAFASPDRVTYLGLGGIF